MEVNIFDTVSVSLSGVKQIVQALKRKPAKWHPIFSDLQRYAYIMS